MNDEEIEKEYEKMWEKTELSPGVWLSHHSKQLCAGENCCLHNPSDHPMKDFSFNWRPDRELMERVCSHGIGHPDPDDLVYKLIYVYQDTKRIEAEWIHGCDGCCYGAYRKLDREIKDLKGYGL